MLKNYTKILFSETEFDFRFRSMLLSIIAGCRYIFVAFSTKLYFNVEAWLSIPGAAAFYGLVSLVGYTFSFNSFEHTKPFLNPNVQIILNFSFIVMFIILPETESRSLEAIELHFSDNSKGLADIHIPKSRNQTNENIRY